MNAREERAFARLIGADSTLRSEGRLRDAPPMYEQFKDKLHTHVERLRELKYAQHKLTPQYADEGKHTASLRKRLRREYMIPLTRIGRSVLQFAPGIERALKVPHARASHRELVTTAEVMLKAVQSHQKLLVSTGFPKTFFTEFRQITQELKRIATTSSQRQAKFSRVTEQLREELASASETLRILDGIMLARTDHDVSAASRWKRVLRTPKPLGRPPSKKRKLSPNARSAPDSPEEPLTVS